jgi:aminoglycoside phosphotransferase (APT) family kinase protein
MADLTDELAAPLGRYLAALTGATVDVRDMERLSSGWESDVYGFTTAGWRGDTPRVLRLYFGDSAARAALREYQALRLLADAGYPVPHVDVVEPATGPLGRTFLIMQRIMGSPIWESIAQLAADAQARVIAELGALLARLHQVDLGRLPSAWPVRTVSISQQIDHLEAAGGVVPLEDLTLALAWLRGDQAMAERQQLGLVHWDYHPNNVLQDANGQRWVIDWTQFQATDVRFDLAWTLLLVGSHAGQTWADALLGGYREAWAAPPDWLGDMTFFDAAACAKRVLSVVISLKAGPDKLGMRPGAEEAMLRLLPAIAAMYRRWLMLTRVSLPASEELLAAHL